MADIDSKSSSSHVESAVKPLSPEVIQFEGLSDEEALKLERRCENHLIGFYFTILIKTVVRKIDLHLIPALFLLFIFNILDRSNIANARLGGLQEDLGLSDTQYQTAVALMVRVDTNSVFYSRLTRPTCPVRWISPWPSS